MKKVYTKAEMEIIEFDTEDVITTSTGEDGKTAYNDPPITTTETEEGV